MGEQINYAEIKTGEKLSYVSVTEIQRVLKAIKDPYVLSSILSNIFRINILYMIEKAGSGHIGTSFSAIDTMTWLWTQEMRNPNISKKKNSDIYFSSKGHDVPALYSVLIGLGKLDFEMIHKLRRLGGLPGHPDVITPYIMTNTGPLGMGVSKAVGMATANRLEGKNGQIYVMCSDGELQEGSFWESLQPAANGKFGEITVIVDHNKIQSDTWVSKTSDLGDLSAKFKAFGWEVEKCNGHDFESLSKIFAHLRKIKSKPKILIADTVKGKGVSFMEKVADDGYYKFHSGAPSYQDYLAGLSELISRVNKNLKKTKLGALNLESSVFEARIAPNKPQKLIFAYGDELVKLAQKHKNIVAMDADLVLDTGLIPFKNRFPERYIECGIAEQHMVSQAGGLALMGKLPIVHSFTCFLSTRPNEQIYNNSTEKTKIIYVGSLAGVLPGGPGHSHQSVRDISLIGSIPGMTIIEPCNEKETRLALKWAVNDNKQSTYIRLVSIPIETPYQLPAGYKLILGQGVEIAKGKDAVIIAYGPVMLTEAVKASRELAKSGISLSVINLPWLNNVDLKWLLNKIRKYKLVVTVDDHYLKLGQGTLLKSELLGKSGAKFISLGLEAIPACGQNQEVLKYHELDYISIASVVSRNL